MSTKTSIRAHSGHTLPSKSPWPTVQRNISTTLNYYRDPGDGSAPTPVYVGGETVTNERPTVPIPVIVRDVTSDEHLYKLDTHGFQYVKHQTKVKSFDDEDMLKKDYYSESAKIYKDITGATTVHLFGHLVRRGPTHWHALGVGNAAKKGPLHRVHVDQSYAGAELVLRKQLPDEADSIIASGKRWQIINLWRPIKTIFKDPIAVAAAHSIPEKDLIEAKVIYTKQPPPLNRNETWAILPGEGHAWFYKNEQKPEDVLLIKCFDSSTGDNLARRAPHCAIVDLERAGEAWTDRESIEIRALVIYDS